MSAMLMMYRYGLCPEMVPSTDARIDSLLLFPISYTAKVVDNKSNKACSPDEAQNIKPNTAFIASIVIMVTSFIISFVLAFITKSWLFVDKLPTWALPPQNGGLARH